MPITLMLCVAPIAVAGGLASYLIAYHQLTSRLAPTEARRRALAAVPGPILFYALLGGAIQAGMPLVLPG
jgi:ABC-type transport system involved in cytochrome c biogenesis permease subunit